MSPEKRSNAGARKNGSASEDFAPQRLGVCCAPGAKKKVCQARKTNTGRAFLTHPPSQLARKTGTLHSPARKSYFFSKFTKIWDYTKKTLIFLSALAEIF